MGSQLSEVSVMQSLQHKHIVQYHSSFVVGSSLCLVMEYCEKGDLSTYLLNQKNFSLAESKIWRFFIELLLGVGYIHSKNIVHRDLKPGNIFLRHKDYEIKIGDFGISTLIKNKKINYDHVGTLYYSSPEVIAGKAYDFKTDVWSLGCVLYQLCTLHPPFESTKEDMLRLRI